MPRPKPIAVQVDTSLPLPEARRITEGGALLFVDFRYPVPINGNSCRRLTVDHRLILDLTPDKSPILLEIRQVVESWKESANLSPPTASITGTARILTAGRVSTPVSLTTDPERTLLHVRIGQASAVTSVEVAPRILFELTNLTRTDASLIQGHLVGVWILDVPRVAWETVVSRAMGLVGPPIGSQTSLEDRDADRSVSERESPRRQVQ